MKPLPLLRLTTICLGFLLLSGMAMGQTAADNAVTADTAVARRLLEEGKAFIQEKRWDEATAKLDSAKVIYVITLGGNSKEVADIWSQKGAIDYNQVRYDSAIFKIQIGLSIKIKILGDTHIEIAQLYNNLGVIHDDKGNYEIAMEYHNKALAIWIKLVGEENINVASSYTNIGSIYYSLDNYELAGQYMEKALKLRINLFGEESYQVAQSLNNLGSIYYSKGDYERAIEYSERALVLKIKLFGEEHSSVAVSYSSLGLDYDRKGDYEQAINYHERALTLNLKLLGKNHPNVAKAYDYIGEVYSKKGDYNKAAQFYQAALKIKINLFDEQNPEVAVSYNNLGTTSSYLGDYIDAIFYFEEALNLRLKLFGEYHSDVAQSYENLGVVFSINKDFNKALFYYQKSFQILDSLFSSWHPLTASAYVRLGDVCDAKEDNACAITYYQKAVQIQTKLLGEKHPDLSNSLYKLANVLQKKNRYLDAEKYFKNSILSLNFTHIDLLSEVSSIIEFINSTQGLSLLYQKWYKNGFESSYLFQSYNEYQKTLKAIDFQLKILSPFSKYNLALTANPIYNGALTTNFLLNKITDSTQYLNESFTFAERSKSYLLYESIQESGALAYGGIPDTLLQQEYDLRVDIVYYDKKRQEKLSQGLPQTDTTVLAISSKLFDLNREYETLKARFERDYPDYYRLKYDLSTVPVEEVQQKLLEPNQTMLEYFVGDSSIFVFVIRPNDYQVKEIPRDFTLDSLVQQLRDGLYGYYNANRRDEKLFKETVNKYTIAAQELYQKLVTPIENLLTEHVVIIPDGVLGYVPFEVLLTAEPKAIGNFGTYPYLINKHSISYCYSATLLREMKQKQHRRQLTKSLLAMAPFYKKSYEYLENQFGEVLDVAALKSAADSLDAFVSRKSFKDLANSGEEAITASKFWKGDYFINNDATEARFNQMAGDYRILHLPTHGVADNRVGDYSYLAFAEVADSVENELLYVRDLYNLQLNADLVILSACETGVGELQRGEGIISLARAFAYAGAKSMVTSLWVANDASTKDLMREFHIQLRKGRTKDGALQQAKLRYVKANPGERAHPFFWAGFVGVGDMRKLK